MVLEPGHRAAQSPEYVEVGRLGGERHGECGISGLAVEARAAEAGSG
jgi:hypothetical protein